MIFIIYHYYCPGVNHYKSSTFKLKLKYNIHRNKYFKHISISTFK